jgi:large subunit ribosomal protein L29
MKTEELRQLSGEELLAKMRDAKEELFNLRFQTATGQLDNTSRIKEVKKDIARIFTIIRERELESERV